MKKSKLVLLILTFSVFLFMGAQNALSADNTLDMGLSKSVSTVNSLLEFNDKLYAGTSGYLYPECGEIYVYDDETGWKLDLVVPNAIQVYSLCEYQNKLYAGTGNSDAKIYVYDPGTDSWKVSFDPPDSLVLIQLTFRHCLAYVLLPIIPVIGYPDCVCIRAHVIIWVHFCLLFYCLKSIFSIILNITDT